MNKHELIHNQERHQYEYHIGDNIARVEYIKSNNGEVYLTHTEVPAALGGQGIASALVDDVLQEIEHDDLKIVPICPFIANYVNKNPKWKPLLMEGMNVE